MTSTLPSQGIRTDIVFILAQAISIGLFIINISENIVIVSLVLFAVFFSSVNIGTSYSTSLGDNNNNAITTNNNNLESYTLLTQWGTQGEEPGQFDSQNDVVPLGEDFLIVPDYNNHRLQKFSDNGTFVEIIGTSGNLEGEFDNPHSAD
ncbi:MAG: hypothetical protein ACREAS_02525, partial [Nitrososphaera sp.]